MQVERDPQQDEAVEQLVHDIKLGLEEVEDLDNFESVEADEYNVSSTDNGEPFVTARSGRKFVIKVWEVL